MRVKLFTKNLKNITGACLMHLSVFKKIFRPALFTVVSPLQPVTLKPMSTVIGGINDWLLTFAAALTIMILIIGGIMYIGSWGDDKRMQMAKKIIMYAVMGLVIILISYAVIITLDKIANG